MDLNASLKLNEKNMSHYFNLVLVIMMGSHLCWGSEDSGNLEYTCGSEYARELNISVL